MHLRLIIFIDMDNMVNVNIIRIVSPNLYVGIFVCRSVFIVFVIKFIPKIIIVNSIRFFRNKGSNAFVRLGFSFIIGFLCGISCILIVFSLFLFNIFHFLYVYS